MTRFASAVVVDARGRVLLQERDEHPAIDPNKWGFCGGHLEPGALEPVGDFTVFHAHSQTLDAFRLYAARLDITDDDVECHEGRRIVFVDPDDAQRLDLTAAARIALPVFLDSDVYRRLAP